MSIPLKLVLSVVLFLVILFICAAAMELIVGEPSPSTAWMLILPISGVAFYAIWKPRSEGSYLDPSGETHSGPLDALMVALLDGWTFRGRVPRSTYWWFQFIFWLCIAAVLILPGYVALVPALASIILFVPNLSVTARRLHDIDRSGWWTLLLIPPLPLVLHLMCLRKGTLGPNRFGIDPLHPDMSEDVAADVRAYRERRLAELAAERGA